MNNKNNLVLEKAAVVDQLNVMSLVSLEILVRRVQLVEQTRRSAVEPRLEPRRRFLWSVNDNG